MRNEVSLVNRGEGFVYSANQKIYLLSTHWAISSMKVYVNNQVSIKSLNLFCKSFPSQFVLSSALLVYV